MTPQKKSRRDAAEKRLNAPLAYQSGDVWLGYVDEKGKPMFKDKDGNPLTYAQLTATQKLEKLDADIACMKKLQPTTKEDGSPHIPCQRQRKRLQALIDAEKRAAAKKVEKAPEKTVEAKPEEQKPESKRPDGKEHKKSKSDRRYM